MYHVILIPYLRSDILTLVSNYLQSKRKRKLWEAPLKRTQTFGENSEGKRGAHWALEPWPKVSSTGDPNMEISKLNSNFN